MKCTPFNTESRIWRCEWPTTTRSGRSSPLASVAATFSGPTPVESYELPPSIPLWISATTTSDSRRSRAISAGAVDPIRSTFTCPRTLFRSQSITPGVVKPVIPTRMPRRRITVCLGEHRRAGRLVLEVGAHHAEGGPAQRLPQEGHPEIEVVVAGRRGVVAQLVHHVDDGVGVPRRHLREVGREGIALEQVAGVHQHDLVGIGGAERIDRARRPDQPARIGPVAHVVPRRRPSVDVRGGDDDEMGGVLDGWRERRQEEQGEQHQGNIRSCRRVSQCINCPALAPHPGSGYSFTRI